MQRRSFLAASIGGWVAAMAGCTGRDEPDSPRIADETLTVTTTTSTYDTGLLDAINVAFEDRFGSTVETVAQGTGAALETARNGDSDVVLVHARSLEDAFLRDGYGINRRDVMFNDFVVVGPRDDPAGIDGMDDVSASFRSIADSRSVFVSRGDNSGTHVKERAIWEDSGVEPGGEWYREAGAGMGEVLTQADLTGGYTLTDRGTFLSQRTALDSSIRVDGPIEGGPDLLANPYGIVAVNPGVHAHVNYDLAMSYIGFITSVAGQEIIEGHTVNGQQVFFPRALTADPDHQQYVPEAWRPHEDVNT